ncbi:toll/interleukin-1 receptor domain-containing protein [Rufibacter latericius]|uniref:Toll/interleukin-1 receptor domain-containing protein n=1 Tax=Rufibacter latericius TaxID=2487040 RepID=A0A3M9MAA5_9BACT|nr:toll/interleukin-1 receptor domain-containing protein [Rufibacter latericius]RNI21793.1 toll/interleukin-1 receptor domain-containing protein [Rufibacter latericius]
MVPNTVFISYSHLDSNLLKSLKRHFKSLKGINFWDDSKILAGTRWEDEISKALTDAKVAILMVSADFLNSTYIINKELPVLLEAAETKGLTILTVLLKPCLFDLHPELNKFQAINSPEKTIIEMNESEQEQTWIKLLRRINELTRRD